MTEKINTITPPSLRYPRYTKKPFPFYRFVPGLNPHPTEDPHGHSYGKENEEIHTFTPVDWPKNEHYLYGVDLYNYAYWWESHEAWEGLWGAVPKNDTRSHFMQGLIQISAAFLKWHLHEVKGVAMLYESAMKYFSFVYPAHTHYMGLDLKTHLSRLADHFKIITAGPLRDWPDPFKDYPFITLKREL